MGIKHSKRAAAQELQGQSGYPLLHLELLALRVVSIL